MRHEAPSPNVRGADGCIRKSRTDEPTAIARGAETTDAINTIMPTAVTIAIARSILWVDLEVGRSDDRLSRAVSNRDLELFARVAKTKTIVLSPAEGRSPRLRLN
ncbi:hypothetical protein JJD41_03675 [Oxynema sp. CENA135]|uniref:hypothetical protein n=1 Tax=Oxynema sp. CENA135 TaxID=984206 RepID=UPI00190DDA0A|nr:hypothetical protein [Oxynema sp. CENA135]MBK4728991.1 hypothetical protein [Oxynema sp. CENA135]